MPVLHVVREVRGCGLQDLDLPPHLERVLMDLPDAWQQMAAMRVCAEMLPLLRPRLAHFSLPKVLGWQQEDCHGERPARDLACLFLHTAGLPFGRLVEGSVDPAWGPCELDMRLLVRAWHGWYHDAGPALLRQSYQLDAAAILRVMNACGVLLAQVILDHLQGPGPTGGLPLSDADVPAWGVLFFFAILTSMETALPKLIAVVGATGSGKSALAHRIAWLHRGELVSADSRQLYRGLDIGSAKDRGTWKETAAGKCYMVDGICEHLVDCLDPQQEWSAAQYKEQAEAVITDILGRAHLPVLVGGTGLYLQAVLEQLSFPDVAPQPALRERLEQKPIEDLQATYASLDPAGALSIDQENRRRLIRAIEVCMVAQRPFSELQTRGPAKWDTLSLAIEVERETLYARLDARVDAMFAQGLVREVRDLLAQGVDPQSNALSGVGYRELARHLQGDMDLATAREEVKRHTRQLAKRQLSWFRRDATIRWVRTTDEALFHVERFLNGNTAR